MDKWLWGSNSMDFSRGEKLVWSLVTILFLARLVSDSPILEYSSWALIPGLGWLLYKCWDRERYKRRMRELQEQDQLDAEQQSQGE